MSVMMRENNLVNAGTRAQENACVLTIVNFVRKLSLAHYS